MVLGQRLPSTPTTIRDTNKKLWKPKSCGYKNLWKSQKVVDTKIYGDQTVINYKKVSVEGDLMVLDQGLPSTPTTIRDTGTTISVSI